MPTTVKNLTDQFHLPESNVVRWNKRILTEEEGIYIVSLSQDPTLNSGVLDKPPISRETLKDWIKKVNGFKLDSVLTYDDNKIIERLSQFWIPDENRFFIKVNG
jgi:hypothetical protein